MGSKTNSQQAPEHWLREITKAKVRQAKPFFIPKNEKIGEKRNLDNFFLGKFGQFQASLTKFGLLGQGKTGKRTNATGKRRKNLLVSEKEEEKLGSRIRGRLSAN